MKCGHLANCYEIIWLRPLKYIDKSSHKDHTLVKRSVINQLTPFLNEETMNEFNDLTVHKTVTVAVTEHCVKFQLQHMCYI